jgi:protein-L-isoaspartate(D-aspartate) O-methyltransferase
MNVEVRQADGSDEAAVAGPWDAILLSGSVAEVPERLLRQLKVGGRLVGIVGQLPMMRAVRIVRSADSAFRTEVLFDVVAPRLDGFGEPTRFSF